MPTPLKWIDVKNRDDIIGGDLETEEDGVLYRSPIASFGLCDGQAVIRGPWVAKLDRNGSGEWEKFDNNPFGFNAEAILPQDIGDGRIFFTVPGLGSGTIFPKGGSKLDPSKVKGLTDWELASTPT